MKNWDTTTIYGLVLLITAVILTGALSVPAMAQDDPNTISLQCTDNGTQGLFSIIINLSQGSFTTYDSGAAKTYIDGQVQNDDWQHTAHLTVSPTMIELDYVPTANPGFVGEETHYYIDRLSGQFTMRNSGQGSWDNYTYSGKCVKAKLNAQF